MRLRVAAQRMVERGVHIQREGDTHREREGEREREKEREREGPTLSPPSPVGRAVLPLLLLSSSVSLSSLALSDANVYEP